MMYHAGKEEHTFKEIEPALWRVEWKRVAWLKRVWEERENRTSVKLKWFLDTDFTTD